MIFSGASFLMRGMLRSAVDLAGLDSKQNKIPGGSHGDEFHWCQDWTSGRHERGFDDGQQQQVPKEVQWWQLPSLEEPSG